MKPTLGGSMFTHNVDSQDYCYKEAIASLCAACDEVVVLDAESTDGTVAGLHDCAQRHPNLRVIVGAKWECRPDYHRLSELANQAKSHLTSDWHFMLQADEVIHEDSFSAIRRAIVHNISGFRVRRLNLYGDLNHCVAMDAPHKLKPCSDAVTRLARLCYPAVSDAESIEVPGASASFLNNIVIFHYGFVRRDDVFLKKTREMQGWFVGPGGRPDQRLDGMEKTFDWRKFIPRKHLSKIPLDHPSFSRAWAEERQREKSIPVAA